MMGVPYNNNNDDVVNTVDSINSLVAVPQQVNVMELDIIALESVRQKNWKNMTLENSELQITKLLGNIKKIEENEILQKGYKALRNKSFNNIKQRGQLVF